MLTVIQGHRVPIVNRIPFAFVKDQELLTKKSAKLENNSDSDIDFTANQVHTNDHRRQ
jgi:hypothetical protein